MDSAGIVRQDSNDGQAQSHGRETTQRGQVSEATARQRQTHNRARAGPGDSQIPPWGEGRSPSNHWLWHSFAQLSPQLHHFRASLEHRQLSPWQVIHCIQSLVVDSGTVHGNFVIGLIRVRNSSPGLCLTIIPSFYCNV